LYFKRFKGRLLAYAPKRDKPNRETWAVWSAPGEGADLGAGVKTGVVRILRSRKIRRRKAEYKGSKYFYSFFKINKMIASCSKFRTTASHFCGVGQNVQTKVILP